MEKISKLRAETKNGFILLVSGKKTVNSDQADVYSEVAPKMEPEFSRCRNFLRDDKFRAPQEYFLAVAKWIPGA